MNKTELIDTIATKISIKKTEAEKMIATFIAIVTTTLKKGGEVALTGFGTFSAKKRAARMGVNPQNPTQKIKIPAVTVPKFKAGKTLKDALK
ncbi:DNA-binding protein HU [Candidatus Kuenenbacteria bacterium HGW-Kuenenbacteria-1]|uniref:DNA-binding protein HU n=1 Tax=Candidatus Kuenenbacteria bacterium HGW-Kuenenbacteria-1 TaxID=2013812 RepID=A0A2N1UNT0_9BACT|nr:MAG: DNA-binding protein HU [Candidatus Kuenenbacteria bacterium HGW-Kuenenbacteria-1]